MHTPEAITYHRNGVYKPGGERIMPGNIRNGIKQPDEVHRYGFNYFNNHDVSRSVLSAIRLGINTFFKSLDSIANVSVMSKYIAEMTDEQNLPLLTDQYTEQMIPAVYQTILAETLRSYNGGEVYLGKIQAYASELCWDWLCCYWYQDSERSLAKKEWAMDFASRAVRVRADYCKLLNEFNSGYDLYYQGDVLKNVYIEEKNKSLEKAITLSGVVSGKHELGKPQMSEEHFKHLDPYVYERLEAQERENNRRLETEARAKRTIKALTSNVKVNSADTTPMVASAKMEEVASKPIVINNHSEEDEMLYAQQQNQSILVNYLNQPILTRTGSTIQIDPHALAGINGAIQQKVVNGQPVFDNSGLPIVVVILPTGQEQLIDLNGQQQHFYMQLINQAQQPGGLVPQQQQHYPQQSGGLVPQQQQQSAPLDHTMMDIPGMEFAGNVEFAKNTSVQQEADNAHLGLTVDVYQPAAGDTTTQQTGLVPETHVETVPAETEVVSTAEDNKYFDLVIDGTVYPAILLEKEEYMSKNMVRVNVMFSSNTHERAVVYIDKKPHEFLVNKESFMNREKHLGYILRREKGEYLARDTGPAVAENTNECELEQNAIEVSVQDDVISSTSTSELLTISALAQQEIGGSRKLVINPFNLVETLPFVGVPDELYSFMENYRGDKFSLLLETIRLSADLECPAVAKFLSDVGDWWITDVIYNRIGVERKVPGLIDMAGDYDKYQPYLVEKGLWDILLSELDKDWELFFEFDYEEMTNIFAQEIDEEEIDAEEETATTTESEEDLVDKTMREADELLAGKDLEEIEGEEITESTPEAYDVFRAPVKVSNGWIMNIESFLPPEDITDDMLIDPAININLWTTLVTAFRAIPYNGVENKYLYMATGNGELLLFKCEDIDMGFVRLIGRRK